MLRPIKAKLAEPITEPMLDLPIEYLDDFAAPVKNANGRRLCVKCAKLLYVRWGLQHGECHCTECGYPGRHYHRIDGQPTVEFTLQYHPKVLVRTVAKARK